MEHSNYSPSRLSRIIKCPGSVKLIDDLMVSSTIPKDTSSSYAMKGTLLHQVFERRYAGVSSGYDTLDTDDQFLIRECFDYLEILTASLGHNNYTVKSESRVDLSKWGLADVWGTLDYRIIDPIKRHIDVIDWKFGSGVPVYSRKNPQLLAYAAGAIGWPTTLQTVTLHIVQPAIENSSTYKLTTQELYEWVHGTLAIAIGRCAMDGAAFNPGVDQCRWCEGKNHCPDRLNFAYETAIKLFDAQSSLAKCPSPEELTDLLGMAPLIEQAIKDIKLYITNEIQLGNPFPGLKLVRGRSNRAWIDEKKTVKWLAENTKIDELYTSKLRSPSQLEKEMKTLKKDEDFKALWDNPPGKITLAAESDKRQAIEPEKKAVNVFADYKATEKLE